MTEQDIITLIEERISRAERHAFQLVGQADLFKSLLAEIQERYAVEIKPRKARKKKNLSNSPQLRAELAQEVAEIMRTRRVNKKDAITIWAQQNGVSMKVSTINTYLSPSVLGKKTFNKYFQGLVKRGAGALKAVNS